MMDDGRQVVKGESKVDVAELRRMADAGCTRTDAGRRLGVTREYVRQLLNKHQIPMRNQQDEKRSRHPEIMRMVSQGLTSPEVAEQTGVSVSTVYMVAKANGHRWPDRTWIDYLPQLRALASEGKTLVQIANAIGKSWQSVARSAKRYGITIRRVKTGPKGIPIERIRELADAGLNGPNIARTLGISPGTVYQRAKAHGIRTG